MKHKIDQTFEELCQHLEEHVQFLLMSSDAFDKGFEGEAKRLAVSLRVLFHDTKTSKSLLAQLGRKETLNYIDSSMPFMEGNLLSEGGLVAIISRDKGPGYLAFLDDCPIKSRIVSFEKWWLDPVFRDAKGSLLSRKDLILAMANQDGGAHVDPALNKTYAELSTTMNLMQSLQGLHLEPFLTKERGRLLISPMCNPATPLAGAEVD